MSQVGNCFWLELPGAQSVVCIPNFWLNLLPPGWVKSWPVAFRILLLRAFRYIRTRKQSFTFHPPCARVDEKGVPYSFLYIRQPRWYKEQETHSFPTSQRKHKTIATLHTRPATQMAISDLYSPGQASLLTTGLLFSISGIWELQKLSPEFTITTIDGRPATVLAVPHLPSPSPSGRSSSYSLFCIQIGLVILSTKLEGSPDSQLEKELPTTYSTLCEACN